MQLHDGVRSSRLDVGGEPLQPFEMIVAVDAELTGKADALLLHSGGARHRQGEAAFGAHHQPPMLGVAEPPVVMALAVGHRRKHEPVLQRSTAGEGERVGQLCHQIVIVNATGREVGASRTVSLASFSRARPPAACGPCRSCLRGRRTRTADRWSCSTESSPSTALVQVLGSSTVNV